MIDKYTANEIKEMIGYFPTIQYKLEWEDEFEIGEDYSEYKKHFTKEYYNGMFKVCNDLKNVIPEPEGIVRIIALMVVNETEVFLGDNLTNFNKIEWLPNNEILESIEEVILF